MTNVRMTGGACSGCGECSVWAGKGPEGFLAEEEEALDVDLAG